MSPTIYRGETLNAIKVNSDLQNGEAPPSSLSAQVVPIIDCTPHKNRVQNYCRTANSSATGTINIVATTPANLYIIGAELTIAKDAACDNGTGQIGIYAIAEGEAGRNICSIACLTLNAQFQTVAVMFPVPIKVQANTAISMNGAFAAGNLHRSGHIYGYITEGDSK